MIRLFGKCYKKGLRHSAWMGNLMNIFETIRSTTTRIERIHSQFLADALTDSLKGDRSLFNGVWKLVASPDWEVPTCAKVSVEEIVKRGRVDICIRCEEPSNRVVGIEVKTDAASATDGQLEKYRDGLEEKFPNFDTQIAYLTPFNRERARDKADSLETVKVFEKFAKVSPNARHVSWLDVADIAWDDNVLWKQHQAYIRRNISSHNKLKVKRGA